MIVLRSQLWALVVLIGNMRALRRKLEELIRYNVVLRLHAAVM